ncbi:MAG TPA: hypothetical protein ENK82_05495 [Campylobacterales bacterium]|nr:hypothetical protein [Campylobacterales bacterium]
MAQKNDHITARELARFFSIEARQLNQILTNMGWIEKKHYVWWVATDLGKQNGAIEYRVKESRVRYVHWNKEVMYNEELISTIKSTVRTYLENNLYEEHIKEHYTKMGYTVWHYAKDQSHFEKNKNITLIAKKNHHIMLIHCRDNQLDISVEELKLFQEQRDRFKEENPVFNNYNLTLNYTMSGFFLTEDAYEYVEESQEDISYEIIKSQENSNTWLDTLLLKDETK